MKNATEILYEVTDLQIEARPFDAPPIPIVKGVSFDVMPGKVVALIGESGSGKTTISLSSLGYTKPGLHFAGGTGKLWGKDMLALTADEKRKMRGEHVAYLAQSAAATFNPALKIGEQVTESAVLSGVPQAEADARALELYHALELPDPDRIGGRYPHQVSGGQLQRLMAAMALVQKPDLLVLDEPTTALDVTTQIEVLKAFKKVIQDEGSAAIYVTHDLAVVAQIADHIVVLYSGKVQEQGPTEQIINNPQHPYTKRLMAAVRPAPADAANDGSSSGAFKTDVPALEVKNITAGYGKADDGGPAITVLRDVNVSVERGHVVGVIGESGCGKSTLARVMAGLLPAADGEVLLDGTPLAPALADRSRDELQKVQFVFQMADTALNPRHTLGDIIGRPLTFYHGLRGRKRRERVAEILDLVELPPSFANRGPSELSGGQKQRVNLARALAANPEVMLCDEVTSALDTIVGANVIKLLTELRDKTGVSYVFISHDLSTVASFADDIVVLYAGRVAEQGPTAQVLAPPFHPYTKLLMTSVPEMRVGWLEDIMDTQEALAGISRGVELGRVGCPFFNRCPVAINGTCDTTVPPNRTNGGHVIACHLELDQLMATDVSQAAE
ncbi:MAG: ABC transporter ATP-binding protein [Pseudomonadota bacterium]